MNANMGKRMRPEEPVHDARQSNKKPRHDAAANYAAAEEIVTARQLQNLLVFEQDQARLLNCKHTENGEGEREMLMFGSHQLGKGIPRERPASGERGRCTATPSRTSGISRLSETSE